MDKPIHTPEELAQIAIGLKKELADRSTQAYADLSALENRISLLEARRIKEIEQFSNHTMSVNQTSIQSTLYCSFCGKSQHEVRKLIAGPTVFVCDECTALCTSIFIEEDKLNGKENSYLRELLKTIKNNAVNLQEFLSEEGFSTIVREIEFPPHLHAAGMTILSSFSSIVRQRYAEQNVRISIQQDGLKVALIIETPDGKKEQIEETLHNYNLVLQQKMTLEEFSENPYQAMELKQQLRIAEMQLQNQRDLLEMEKRHSDHLAAHNSSLEKQIADMTSLLAVSLERPNTELNCLKAIVECITKSSSKSLQHSLKIIESKVTAGLKENDAQDIAVALDTIKKEDDSVFKKIREKVIALAIEAGMSKFTSWAELIGQKLL